MSSQIPLDQYSIIKKPAFEGSVGALFALAILAAIARFIVRMVTRRPLYWDDLALAIGAACLTVATALVLKNQDNFFLANTLQQNPSAAFLEPPDVLNNLLSNSIVYLYSFLALAWTTVFAVKISFLIFFKQLIHRLGKIIMYYWIVTGITVVSWAFLVAEPFILCPKFGFASLQCYGPSRDKLYVGMTALVTALDVLTDIMIASIPILVLQKSQIPRKQKVILACFLCLSLVMAAFAITRVSKIRGSSNVDVVWEIFWQYMEAGIAVLMCSLTVFRTIFNTNKHNGGQKRKWEPSASWIQRMKWKKSSEKSVDSESDGLPSIPKGTLSGLRTFIRRNNRSTAATTYLESEVGLSQMDQSQLDTIDEEKHYHGINVKKDYTVSSIQNFSRRPLPPPPTLSSDGSTLNSGTYDVSYGGNTMVSAESRYTNNH